MKAGPCVLRSLARRTPGPSTQLGTHVAGSAGSTTTTENIRHTNRSTGTPGRPAASGRRHLGLFAHGENGSCVPELTGHRLALKAFLGRAPVAQAEMYAKRAGWPSVACCADGVPIGAQSPVPANFFLGEAAGKNINLLGGLLRGRPDGSGEPSYEKFHRRFPVHTNRLSGGLRVCGETNSIGRMQSKTQTGYSWTERAIMKALSILAAVRLAASSSTATKAYWRRGSWGPTHYRGPADSSGGQCFARPQLGFCAERRHSRTALAAGTGTCSASATICRLRHCIIALVQVCRLPSPSAERGR